MTERPFTTAVYLLRCLDVGLRPSDLHDLDVWEVEDLLIERGNDSENYQQLANQDDFDRF